MLFSEIRKIKIRSIRDSMQNKKLQVWLPFLLSLMIVAGMLIGYKIRGNMPGNNIFYTSKPRPVDEVIRLINEKYVDEENADSLGDDAINGMLSHLDPHSVFIPADDLQFVKEDLRGNFFGIGVEFNIINDTIHIINVLEKGPSEKAGLMIGDKLLKVGDSSVAGNYITSEKIKKLLRGSGGTKAELTMLRDDKQKHFTVIRGMIPLYSVDAAYIIAKTIGYIRLNKFSETTYKEFMQATEKLQKLGMKNMILDLRDNGGGILTEATDIADEFLDEDKLITYTEGKHSPKKEYRCKREGIFEKGKVVVLADDGTASASEVLIGALQDWDRATVVGRRTFGKGLVQEQYELSDGSGLRLTVARYYTPLGRSIQKSYSNGTKAYKDELMDRYHDGELLSADSIKHVNAKAYKTKSGKTVYDAGGITPDIFVSIDTTGLSRELSKAYLKGTINDFVYENYINNKPGFSSYNSIQDFIKNYVVDDATIKKLYNYAAHDSLNFNLLTARDKQEIAKQIKILTARQVWHNEGLWEVSNANDPMIEKALDVLK